MHSPMHPIAHSSASDARNQVPKFEQSMLRRRENARAESAADRPHPAAVLFVVCQLGSADVRCAGNRTCMRRAVMGMRTHALRSDWSA